MTNEILAFWTPGPIEILMVLIVFGIPVFIPFRFVRTPCSVPTASLDFFTCQKKPQVGEETTCGSGKI